MYGSDLDNDRIITAHRLTKSGDEWTATFLNGIVLRDPFSSFSPYRVHGDSGQAVIGTNGTLGRALVGVDAQPLALHLLSDDYLDFAGTGQYGPVCDGEMLYSFGQSAMALYRANGYMRTKTIMTTDATVSEIQSAVPCCLDGGFPLPVFGYKKHEWATKYGDAYFYHDQEYRITDLAETLTAQNTCFLLNGNNLYVVYHVFEIEGGDSVSVCYLQAWAWVD